LTRALDVTVASGIVTVGGQVDQRTAALNMLGAIGHLEGVVSVSNRVTYLS
jgi:osmotically-inducible protein OsmY